MKRLSVVVLCLALVFATGCSKESPPVEQPGPHKVIAVGSQWYGHIPVWIGIENGIFERHGFEVECRPIGKSMDRLNAISSVIQNLILVLVEYLSLSGMLSLVTALYTALLLFVNYLYL